MNTNTIERPVIDPTDRPLLESVYIGKDERFVRIAISSDKNVIWFSSGKKRNIRLHANQRIVQQPGSKAYCVDRFGMTLVRLTDVLEGRSSSNSMQIQGMLSIFSGSLNWFESVSKFDPYFTSVISICGRNLWAWNRWWRMISAIEKCNVAVLKREEVTAISLSGVWVWPGVAYSYRNLDCAALELNVGDFDIAVDISIATKHFDFITIRDALLTGVR